MSRKYQFESVPLPTGTNNDALKVDDHPTRFLPGEMTLSIVGLTGGAYSILITAGPLAAAAVTYVDPETGLASFSTNRAFRLPSCRSVTVQLAAATGTVIPFIGGVSYTPNQ